MEFKEYDQLSEDEKRNVWDTFVKGSMQRQETNKKRNAAISTLIAENNDEYKKIVVKERKGVELPVFTEKQVEEILEKAREKSADNSAKNRAKTKLVSAHKPRYDELMA